MRPEIDVLIPTAKKRVDNLLFQIRSALGQGLDVRVTIAMNGEYPELMERLTDEEKKKMRFVTDAPDGCIGNPAVLHALETLDWADWYFQTGDDDALLPWGLKHLYENREGVCMVVGRALCVTKDGHKDLTPWEVGKTLEFCKVSGACALFNFRAVEKLPRPWWNPGSQVSDFELIHRMSRMCPYRLIPSVIFVLALEETSVLRHFVR